MAGVYVDLLATVLPSISSASVAVLSVMGLLVAAAYARFGVQKVHGLFVTDPHDALPNIESARFGGQVGNSYGSFPELVDSPGSGSFDFPELSDEDEEMFEGDEDRLLEASAYRNGGDVFPQLPDADEFDSGFADTVASGSGSAFTPSFDTPAVWTDELIAVRQAEFSAFQKTPEGIAEDAAFDAMYSEYEERKENGNWPVLDSK